MIATAYAIPPLPRDFGRGRRTHCEAVWRWLWKAGNDDTCTAKTFGIPRDTAKDTFAAFIRRGLLAVHSKGSRGRGKMTIYTKAKEQGA
jgi:hypothetical protein